MIDLSDRQQYLAVLEKIQKFTQKIILVQIDGPIKDDPIVRTAFNLLHLEKKEVVNAWCGTTTKGGRGAVQYTFSTIRNKREFFDFLASWESFWTGIENLKGFDTYDENSLFDDIAFLDDKGELLFYSTTHEDEFYIRKNLL